MPMKYLLNRIGARLPEAWLRDLQAAVNYLTIGRWVRDHGFEFPARVRGRRRVWEAMVERIGTRRVLYLEFGVAEGSSIRWWSTNLKSVDARFHGFDSFEGLPEEGGPWKKHQFDMRGRIPAIDDSRVSFHKGWFENTLPTFEIQPHDLLILNLDADLYSSTIYVLRQLRPYLRKGTLVYFDEFNHPTHEPRALEEFMAESRIGFAPFAADRTLAHVCFECLGNAG